MSPSVLKYVLRLEQIFSLDQTRETWGHLSEFVIDTDLGSFSLGTYEGMWLLLQLALLSVLPVSVRL